MNKKILSLDCVKAQRFFKKSSVGTPKSAQKEGRDYCPFGLELTNKQYVNGESYRYGFNGKENDNDFGDGVQDYGFRLYDRGVVRFLSVDPLAPEYPWYTPYQFAGNKPIKFIDLDGLEEADPEDFETAKSILNNIPIGNSAYRHSNRVDFYAQMLDRISDKGESLNQGHGPWLCGVAACTHLLANYKPIEYAKVTKSLYEAGSATTSSGAVIKTTPYIRNKRPDSQGLFNHQELSDYVLMTAIRHTENDGFAGAYEPGNASKFEEGTLPWEIEDILGIFGLEAKRQSIYPNWGETLLGAMGIEKDMKKGLKTILFVDYNLYTEMKKTEKLSHKDVDAYNPYNPAKHGIHYVVLTKFKIHRFANSKYDFHSVTFSYWDYGGYRNDQGQIKTKTVPWSNFVDSVKGFWTVRKKKE